MSKINLDELTDYESHLCAGRYCKKKELLREALPIIKEIQHSKDYISWMTVMGVDGIIVYLEQLLNTK